MDVLFFVGEGCVGGDGEGGKLPAGVSGGSCHSSSGGGGEGGIGDGVKGGSCEIADS